MLIFPMMVDFTLKVKRYGVILVFKLYFIDHYIFTIFIPSSTKFSDKLILIYFLNICENEYCSK